VGSRVVRSRVVSSTSPRITASVTGVTPVAPGVASTVAGVPRLSRGVGSRSVVAGVGSRVGSGGGGVGVAAYGSGLGVTVAFHGIVSHRHFCVEAFAMHSSRLFLCG